MSYRTHTTKPLNAWLKDIYAAAERKRFAQVATGVGALVTPFIALANPSGGQVVGGAASIATPAPNGTVITQSTQSAAINWQQFSIGSNEFVQFIQPSSSSVVLNRVVGGSPSAILGTLTANGQVFLVNQNGIFFSKTASLDVQGLVASTLDIKTSDFMSGHYVFSKAAGAPDASVVNQGAITTGAGGYVVLAGDYVENDGIIDAETGRVVLAANSGTTLTLGNNSLISYTVNSATLARLAGVSNTGDITADGGAVVMTADVANALTATAVNNSGFIAAHSIQDHGGVIILSAQGGGEIQNSGTLDASATATGAAGGIVVLRGDGKTELTSTSNIDTAGDGARGGFIELSGHTLNIAGGVDAGKSGSLLIDPSVLTIVAGGAGPTGTTSTVTVGVGYLQSHLNSPLNLNLTLVASNSIGHSPGVTAITATTGHGNLTIKTGTLSTFTSGGTFAGGLACQIQGVCLPQANGPVFLTKNAGTINLAGVNITLGGSFSANAAGPSAVHGTINTGNITAAGINLVGAHINVGNLMATVTSIDILSENTPSSGSAVVQAGTLNAAHNVSISQSGSGHVSVGAINAGWRASVGASGASHADFIKINGDVVGSDVNIHTRARNDGNITITGSNGVTARSGSITLAASETSIDTRGGNINVSGDLKALNGRVHLTAFGGTNTAGDIQVGNISAGDSVVINATNSGGVGSQFKVHTGNITAGINSSTSRGDITINMRGHDPQLSVGALMAKGRFGVNSSCECESARSSHGFIHLGLNHGGTYSGGSIKVNGQVESLYDSVSFYVKNGDITMGAGTNDNIYAAGQVKLAGNTVALNTVSGDNISITGNVVNAAAAGVTLNAFSSNSSASLGNVIVHGNITTTAGDVTINATGAGSRSLDVLTGDISAAGSVTINANYTGRGSSFYVSTGKITAGNGTSGHGAIAVTMTGNWPSFIASGALTAKGPSNSVAGRHGFINVDLHPTGSNAGISIAGPVKSSHGSVALAQGQQNGYISVGTSGNRQAVSAAGFVDISGGKVNVGKVTSTNSSVAIFGNQITTGAISAVAGSVYLSASGSGHPYITVNGPITAKTYVGVNLYAGSASRSGSINLKDVTTTGVSAGNSNVGKVDIQVSARSCGECGGSRAYINVGAIKTTGGGVNISQSGYRGSIHVGSPSAGAPSVSGINAGGALKITTFAAGSGGSINLVGPVIAKTIQLSASASGSGANINAQTLEATGNFGSCECGNSGMGVVLKTNWSGFHGASYGGGKIMITGGSASLPAIKADSGGVLIYANGGGYSSGGAVIVPNGDIVATGVVQITASHLGSGYGGFINLRNVTGAAVHLQAYASNPSISVGAITANGTAGTAESGHPDDVNVSADARGYGGMARIDVHGPVKSSHGAVTLDAGSRGSVSMASSVSGHYGITAGSGVSVDGRYVTLGNVASAKSNIFITGSQINTGGLTATSGSVSIYGRPASFSTARIQVNGPITAKSGVFVGMSFNSPQYGGSIDLQDVTTTGTGVNSGQVDIYANAGGNSSHQVGMHITVGAIKTAAGNVYISQAGVSGSVRMGSSSAAAAGVRGASIGGALRITTNVTSDGGSINLTGPVKANAILLSAVAGHSGGNINAQTLEATGHFNGSMESGNTGLGILVSARATGGTSAFGGNVKITGGSGSITPAVKADAGGVRMFAQGGSDSGGQIKITNGDIVAVGAVDITASNVGSCCGASVSLRNVTGTTVHIQANGPSPNISVGAITANGTGGTAESALPDDVRVQLNTGFASSGHITINGPVKSSHGDVVLDAGRTNLDVGSFSSPQTITAGGNVNLHAGHMRFGNISAGGVVYLSAVASSSNGGASITALNGATIKGKSVSINMNESGIPSGGGSITLGDVTADGASASAAIHINAFMPGKTLNLVTGNLLATRSVTVQASAASSKAGGSFSLGAVTAPHININAGAGMPSLKTGKLTAVSTAGPVSIVVSDNTFNQSNSIDVVGGISASGKTSASPFSLNGQGQPMAAQVLLNANGGASFAHHVTITGAVNVTAHAGAYSFSGRASVNESGPAHMHATGTGGVAEFDVFAQGNSGSANINGTITVTGPDATVNIFGNTVSVGAINVTGSGHTVSKTITKVVPAGLYSSNNSAGVANLNVSGMSISNAAKITTGNISVSGKGAAQVALDGLSVSAGNVTVTATAAAGSRHQTGTFPVHCITVGGGSCGPVSSEFFRGILNGVNMHSGSLHAGAADLFIGLNRHFSNSNSLASNIKVGAVNVTGVGHAGIDLAGVNIVTGNLTATATKGSMHGTGSSNFLGSAEATVNLKRTFSVVGGGAGIDLETRSSNGSGTVSVTGNINASGPNTGVDIKGKTIKVTGNVSGIASGGTLTSDLVATSVNGGYHVHYVGAGKDNAGVELHGGGSSGSVNVGGTVTVKGPGFVGLVLTGHNVSVGGISASASATKHYSILDTRVSPAVTSFTAGSLLVAVDGVNITGPTNAPVLSFTQANVNGGVTLHAVDNVYLPANLNATGALHISAGGNIVEDPSPVVARIHAINMALSTGSNSSHFSPSIVTRFTAHGSTASLTAGGSINMTGNSLTASKGIKLKASTDVLLNKAFISGSAVSITAKTGITNGGAASASTITATAGNLTLKTSTGNIVMNGETLNASGGGASLSAAAGSLNLANATVTAKGAETLKAGTFIAINHTVLSGSAVSATAHSGITNVGTASAGTITATSGKLTLKTTTSSILLTGEKLNATGGAALLSAAAGSLDLSSATVTAKGTETLKAGTNILINKAVLSGSVFNASAAAGKVSNGGLTSAGTITATAGGSIKAHTSVDLKGETLHVGTGALTLSAATGNLSVSHANISAGGKLTAHAGKLLDMSTASAHLGSLAATAGSSINLVNALVQATNAVTVTAGKDIFLVNTRISGSTFNISATAGKVSNAGSSGSLKATVSGSIKAHTLINLTAETLHVSGGALTVSAATGSVGLHNANISAGGKFTAHAGTNLNMTGGTATVGSAALTAGSGVDLSSQALTASTAMSITAGKDILLKNTVLSASVVAVNATGNVGNNSSGGSITGKGIAITAGNNLNLAGATVTVGKGAAPGVTGDAAVIAQFGVTNPNLALIATNTLNGPNIAGSASYVLLEGNTLGTQGTATLASGAVVQFRPFTLSRSVGVNPTAGTQQTQYLVSELASFTGDQVVIGATGLTGGISIGSTGAVNLAGIDLTLLDTGNVTGAGLLTANSVTVLGATGTVSLVTNSNTVNVVSATNISIDNTADSSSAAITFGAAATGNVTAKFGGGGTLKLANSTFGNIDASFGGAGAFSFGSGVTTVNATGLTLVEGGAPLNLGALAFNLTGAANLSGIGISGTGLITASAITANAHTGNLNLVTNTAGLTVTAANNVTVTNSHAAGMTLGFGSGSFGAVSLTAAGGATLQSALKANSVFLNVGGGALILGNNVVTVTTTATLQGLGVAGTGLLTAGAVAVNGGAGNVSLVTKSNSLIVSGGNNVTLDNSAFTGITAVNFINGPYAAVTLDFGGNGILSGFTLTASAIDLNAANGNLTLTASTLSATGAVTLTAGQNLILSGAHVTAGAFNATAHGSITDTGVTGAGAITATSASLTAGTGKILLAGETLHVTAGAASLTAGGGSIDLTSASLTASQKVSLTAKTHVLLGKTFITGSAVSATAQTGSISNGGSAGGITATTGNATFTATNGAIVLGGGSLNVGGTATFSGHAGIDLTGATLIAGSAAMVAGNSIDLTGVTAHVTNTLALGAHNIVLSGVTLTTGKFIAAATGTIHNGAGPGTITANAMELVAANGINLSSTQLNIGAGTITGLGGDVGLFQDLVDLGIPFVSQVPNGAFITGGNLVLKGVNLTGTYLYLQGAGVSILGPASAPAGAVIQVTPIDSTVTIGIEGSPATTSAFNLSNQGFIGLFPGATVVVGTLGDPSLQPPTPAEVGDVAIGANGPFTLANNTNLIILTAGTVTGLANVSGTGIIKSLSTVLGPPIPPVTAGEVDSTTLLPNPDDKKKQNGDTGNTDTGSGTGTGTVTQDTGTASVCH